MDFYETNENKTQCVDMLIGSKLVLAHVKGKSFTGKWDGERGVILCEFCS